MRKRPAKLPTLVVENFAQIDRAELAFGDLTVLVGAQGTGKSLVLQWLKTALDGLQIVKALRDSGQGVETVPILVDLVFGVGMMNAWREGESAIAWEGKSIDLSRSLRRTPRADTDTTERVFFIPAHRSLLIGDGWAQPFQRFTAETPVVARIFSQRLFELFSEHTFEKLFPRDRILKKAYRERINDAIFHGGTIGIENSQNHAKKLKLTHGDAKLPFMTWTAGQREFTPLLFSLYHLLPSQRFRKNSGIEWVVIEEPEMGLHPQAITAFLLLVLDLLWRGYRVVLSTHSPHVVSAVWMLQRLKEFQAKASRLSAAFGVKGDSMKDVAEAALKKEYKTYLMAFGANGKVSAQDISALDPGAEDEGMAGWGGLTGFTSKFSDAVRRAANETP